MTRSAWYTSSMLVQMTTSQYTKVVLAFAAGAYSVAYASTPVQWHFIDNLDLLIHEAGHVIFYLFGTFLYILGGSLFQILFPFVFVVYFWLGRNFYAASIVLHWVGMNCINVSVYASDAVRMQLPLLGGDSTTHDWHYILGTLNLLPHTDQVGACLYGLGVFGMILAFCASIVYSFDTASDSKLV